MECVFIDVCFRRILFRRFFFHTILYLSVTLSGFLKDSDGMFFHICFRRLFIQYCTRKPEIYVYIKAAFSCIFDICPAYIFGNLPLHALFFPL